MDNLCHTLVGAAMGEAGLKSRARHGNVVLMIAANLPDIDVLAFAAGTPIVALRRGWTHGIGAQALLPLLLTAIILGAHRLSARGRDAPSPRAAPLLLLAYAGVLSHVALDWLNTYGVRLLMPFSTRWFYGDSVFIIDPWLWLVFGAGVIVARRSVSRQPARVALLVATLYVAAMVASAIAARRHVLDAWARRHGHAPSALMVGPVPVNPLRRAVIADQSGRYHTGTFTWWPRAVTFDDRITPALADHPAVRRARDHPDVRAVLTWARFPYYELERVPAGTRVTLRDMRFGDRVGGVSVIVPDRDRGDGRGPE